MYLEIQIFAEARKLQRSYYFLSMPGNLNNHELINIPSKNKIFLSRSFWNENLTGYMHT